MKLRTWAVAATAGAVGYVFGTAAGRAKFEQIKSRAREVAADPKVQQNISDLASKVAGSADKINSPVGGVIKGAADKVQTSLKHDQVTPPPTGTTSPSGV